MGMTEGSITDPTRTHRPRPASSQSWLDRWMALLRTIGNVQAWLLLTVFYVLIIAPFGLIFRLAADPLRLRRRSSTWQSLERHYDQMDQAIEQS